MADRPRRANADPLDAGSKPGDDSHSTDVKERIYLAALGLFSRKGYDAVSVRDICQASQTTAPMVYYYFKNKNGLYRYILNEALSTRRQRIEQAVKLPGDPTMRLRNVLEAWAGVQDDEPAGKMLRLFFLREVFGMGSENYKRSLEAFDRQVRHSLRDILQDGVEQKVFRPVRVEMAVLAIIGIMNTFIRRVALDAPFQVQDGVEQVMDTFMYGLAAPRMADKSGAIASSAGVSS